MTDESPFSVRPIAKSAQGRIHQAKYDPTQTLGEARRLYFESNGFPADGGYDSKWVDFELGPIPMPFPNTESRRRAVKLHDLHHLLTGYHTDIYGELEISAWELAAGCHDHYAAWVLNLGGMAMGMLTEPRRIWRAWLRGRRSRSLYSREFSEDLLDRRLGELRAEQGLDRSRAELGKANAKDIASFLLFWEIGTVGTLALAPLAVLFVVGGVSTAALRRWSEKR